jgi:heme exporter protein D
MDRIQEFLAMGGYAAYVWPAYGLAVVTLVGIVGTSITRLRAAERSLEGQGGAKRRRNAAPQIKVDA